MSETLRVLLVEDETLIGEMVRMNLQHRGFDVDWVQDGSAGQDAACRGQHDILLLDLMLPGRSGREIAAAARAAGVTAPILMLTAVSNTESKVQGLEAGADDYLTKPFDMAELFARINALLRRPA